MPGQLGRPLFLVAASSLAAACVAGGTPPLSPPSVADTLTRAQAPDGEYIAWREHRIDDEAINGGIALRGGDGLQLADIDRDGFVDIVSVHEDSNHLRIAFGSADPDRWTLATIASGPIVAAIEDVAVGDLDGDGWSDLVTANEEAHLAFFKNPGTQAKARVGDWRSAIPATAQGRGSWLRVFIADIDGDGRNDVTAANKGASDIVDPGAARADRSTSLFKVAGDPLDPAAWQEQVLITRDVPNTAMPVDYDGDGDLDILAAARLEQQLILLENRGILADGTVLIAPHELVIDASAQLGCSVSSTAFQSTFADMDGDGRLDLVVGVTEKCGDARAPGGLPALGWLRQPEVPGASWIYRRIGDVLPDMVIGIGVADIDGDGDLDVVTGGYSGLNILKGGYSDASREADHPGVTAASTVGRIAWFANPGDPARGWTRHDITRQVRGMYDQFEARDMDGDGDIDLVSTRGNSGALDGVFWLEQLRSPQPVANFQSAHAADSRALPLPPADWIDRYVEADTLVPPNKR